MNPVILSYDGFTIQDSTYEAYFPGEEWIAQADSEAVFAPRAHTTPKLTYVSRQPHFLPVAVRLRGITANAADTLKSHFDTSDPTEKTLIIKDVDNSNKQWYVTGPCVRQVTASQHLLIFVLAVGDMIWLEQSQSSQAWPVTGTGDTQAMTVGGNVNTQAILEIQPTSIRAGGTDNGFAYRRFVTAHFPIDQAARNYSIDITNGGLATNALVGAGKMQADGDDVRVYVDGVETERWFQDFNGAATKIWITADWVPRQTALLEGNHTDATTTLTVQRASPKTQPLRDFPAEGYLLVESEVMFFSAKNDNTDELTVVRARKGTAAAAHNDGVTVYWLEHDIMLYYGNAAMSAPTQTDAKKPIFNLTSTNTSWDYDDFATQAGRPYSWTPAIVKTSKGNDQTNTYTANHATDAATAAEMGMTLASYLHGSKYKDEKGEAVWTYYHPCGITHVQLSGEKYRSDDDWPGTAALQIPIPSGKKNKLTWTNVWNEATPALEDTWTNLAINASNEALGATYNEIRLALAGAISAGAGYLAHMEVSDVTLTLTNTPTVSLGSEQSSTYEFNATITNNTTSKAIKIQGSIPLNDTLIVDGETKQVYLSSDGSPLLSYFRRTAPRFPWLELQPGSNTLQYDEDGAAGLTITVKWRDRNN